MSTQRDQQHIRAMAVDSAARLTLSKGYMTNAYGNEMRIELDEVLEIADKIAAYIEEGIR